MTPPENAAIPTCDDANCEGVGTDHIGPCNLNDEDPCYLDPECEHPRHDPSSHPCGPRLAEGASTPGLPSWVLPDEGDKAVPAAPPASPPPPGSAAAEMVTVPLRWVDEVVLALDAATRIGIRSCRPGDGLHIGNHDRLIREAQQWSVFARDARSLPSHGGVRGR